MVATEERTEGITKMGEGQWDIQAPNHGVSHRDERYIIGIIVNLLS